jgi:hypothetical protein
MSFVPRTLRCPSCNEMINESVPQCGFCSVPIDRGTAQLIADKQQRANKACSDASYLRTATIAMFVFLGLSVIPFIPLVTLAFDIVFIVVVVLVILWQVRYNGLIISDHDIDARGGAAWLRTAAAHSGTDPSPRCGRVNLPHAVVELRFA